MKKLLLISFLLISLFIFSSCYPSEDSIIQKDNEYAELEEKYYKLLGTIYSTESYGAILYDYFDLTEGIPQEVYGAWESYNSLISQFY